MRERDREIWGERKGWKWRRWEKGSMKAVLGFSGVVEPKPKRGKLFWISSQIGQVIIVLLVNLYFHYIYIPYHLNFKNIKLQFKNDI